MEHPSVEMMWQNYRETLGDCSEIKNYNAWHFCNNEGDANTLAELVKRGIKTATSSLHLLYELENEALPQVGEFNIITDWEGRAQAVIETLRVDILPFKEVNAEFAAKEGEGDRTLNYWRDVHIRFFSEELADLKHTFSEDVLVVCETFKVVYK
ncbi:uncharacterized protein YhfF [Pullulanibacillus pueri]|uniref:RNA-binding protein n=1 Tax=Pullulanibacillus pueri TaxID=1437324 RepID=A0A8J3ELP8_9BACL|nr:ASCH domain-containing protein [Pullulanibacillus pueri]MBM7682554.1 uncharacterized protein YhfF [Pullulanibacillus pueri]GGH81945.1 RNA-binding protein [Pullulanibacillus pueri]